MPPLLTQVARVSDGLPLVATQTPTHGLPVTPKDQQEAREILKKITSSMSGKMSITSGDKVFYYMTRDSLCFLAMAEARYPKRLAFLYLDEIGDLVLGELVQEFGNQWRDEVNNTARPFRFIHYDPIIQRKQKEFQDERQQRSKLNDDLSEIQNIMKKNINDILDRGEKLDNVQNISQDLLKQSSGFKWGARKLTFQARMQQYLPMVVIGLIVVFVIYVKFFCLPTMKRVLLTIVGLDAIAQSSGGGLWGVRNSNRNIHCCRGGSLPPSNYEQGGQMNHNNNYGGYVSNNPPPPELPGYGDEDPLFSQQGPPPPHHPLQHGSSSSPPPPMYSHEPPPLPPQYGGDVPGGMMMPPPPPGYHPNPEDASFFLEADDEPDMMMDGLGVGGPTQDTSGMDLSTFDKEYILKGLARLYRKKILPLELSSRYGHFHSPPLSPSDFVAPPMVLLLGQYSVGKTSFIKYLVGRDFPGIRVGPEPTTDRFTAILGGPNDKIIPGAALCSQQDRPFTGLSPFGNNFLSRLEGVELDSPILFNVTLVDTPGILSGQKQRSRNYDYENVMKWFGERADLIIVMFDAHKLDISDELKRVMELLIPHLDKIRIVLNKADSVSTQQLMRVYGALMWSLGKVMNTPEVCRVYMGSFWDAPLQNTEQAELLQREEMDLLQDIMRLPQQAVMRRINELVKRARSVKVHAYIIHYLRKQLPYTFGKRDKQKRLISRLESEFLAAARRYGLPKGDFPAVEPFRQALLEIKDLSEFPKLDKRLVREMDKVFSVDIPDLLEKAKNH